MFADTGRLVGTGTSGTAEARLAIARAVRQLAMEAGVYLRVARFEAINVRIPLIHTDVQG